MYETTNSALSISYHQKGDNFIHVLSRSHTIISDFNILNCFDLNVNNTSYISYISIIYLKVILEHAIAGNTRGKFVNKQKYSITHYAWILCLPTFGEISIVFSVQGWKQWSSTLMEGNLRTFLTKFVRFRADAA